LPDRSLGRDRLPWTLRLAQLARALPELRGRDRLLSALIASAPPVAHVSGTFGGGLRFEGDPSRDANVLELAILRFARPALAPVLDAALGPGDVFADVGANLGLYTLWGARRVGASGSVVAFEPVPETRASLERNVALNGFRQVEIVAAGVGAEPGRIALHRHPGASGVASRFAPEQGPAVEVPVTTLDAEFARRPHPPRLVKIDVEGMEIEVLRGASRLLAGGDPPLVVLEANPQYFEAAGTDYPELDALLAARGYELWALRPAGLRREPRGAATPGSLNVFAARAGHEPHRRVLARLAGVRFARNMNA
jgi:FkbM family methyltransferase